MTRRFIVILALLISLFSGGVTPVIAREQCENISCSDTDLDCVNHKKSCWENSITEAQQQALSLENTITLLNSQIQLQQLQVSQTEAEIAQLEAQIGQLRTQISGLEASLDQLSTLLVQRVQAQYKRQTTSPLSLLLFTRSLNNFLSQQHYLKRTEQELSQNLAQTESQRLDYAAQKNLKEHKQLEVEQKRLLLKNQETELAQQKADQQQLLTQSKNNKQLFERELEKTVAEARAIQAILAGLGKESEVGQVEEGQVIASSIITGASACSTGTHLHFEVARDGIDQDPASFLKSAPITWLTNSSDPHFEFTGSWNWPIDEPAVVTQGWGMSYYARIGRYGGFRHTGIDILSRNNSLRVLAVKPGKLYRGSYTGCPEGTALTYVKVQHEDATTTYYLHVNY
jgi:peptidoglycan hydrolase CwlO-like protein